MMSEGNFPIGCGVAIPLDDVVIDEDFELENESLKVDDELLILSPWSMCFRGEESRRREVLDTLEHFWVFRDRSMFMREADIGVCGVVQDFQGFLDGVRLTDLRIKRLMRAEYDSVKLPTEQTHVARDLIIITTSEGVDFGIYSDNASRLGLS